MHPLVLLALGAGGAYMLMKPKKGPSVPSTPVSELNKGSNYAIMATVSSAIGTTDRATAANMISGTFGATCGKVLSVPAPLNAGEESKFKAGQPSVWVFNLQWGRDEKFFPGTLPWLVNASAYMIPSG